MGLFTFIKEAGEKLFGGKEAQAATAAAPTQDELNTKAAKAIETYIASQIQNTTSATGGIIYGAPRQFGLRASMQFGN